MKVELDEMEPVLAGLVSRIGGLNGKKATDALARAGKLYDSSYSLTLYKLYTLILHDDSSFGDDLFELISNCDVVVTIETISIDSD